MTDETQSVVELLASIHKEYKETQKAQTEIQKQTTETLATLIKQGETLGETVSKLSDTLEKTTIPGQQMENKPKNDGEQVGDPVKAPNELAPGQPGPLKTAPTDEHGSTDRESLSMENKAEDTEVKVEKEDDKEDKKEEIEKEDHKEDEKKMEKEDDKEDEKKMEKAVSPDGYEYEVIKAVRSPYISNRKEGASIPNGAQILKAFRDGWGGKHSMATNSYEEVQRLVQKIGGFE